MLWPRPTRTRTYHRNNVTIFLKYAFGIGYLVNVLGIILVLASNSVNAATRLVHDGTLNILLINMWGNLIAYGLCMIYQKQTKL